MSGNNGNNWSSWIPIIGSAVGALGNIGGNRKNRELQENINNKNIQYQIDENYRNRQFAQDMWDKQNAYNDPSAVMARAQKAGINKWTVASNGNTTTAASPVASPNTPAPQAQHYDYGKTNASEIGNAIGSFSPLLLQMQQAQATKANTDADTFFKKENAKLTASKTTYQDYQNEIQAIDLANYPDWKANQMKQQAYQTFKSQNEAFQTGITSEFLAPQLMAQLNLTEEQARKIDNDIDVMWKNYKLSAKDVQTRRMTALSNIKLNNEQVQQVRANVSKINADTAKIIVDTGISRNNVDKSAYEYFMAKEKYNNYLKNGGKLEKANADLATKTAQIYNQYAQDKAQSEQNLRDIKQFQAILDAALTLPSTFRGKRVTTSDTSSGKGWSSTTTTSDYE